MKTARTHPNLACQYWLKEHAHDLRVLVRVAIEGVAIEDRIWNSWPHALKLGVDLDGDGVRGDPLIDDAPAPSLSDDAKHCHFALEVDLNVFFGMRNLLAFCAPRIRAV